MYIKWRNAILLLVVIACYLVLYSVINLFVDNILPYWGMVIGGALIGFAMPSIVKFK